MKNKLAALGVSLLVIAAIVVTILLRDQGQEALPSSPSCTRNLSRTAGSPLAFQRPARPSA